MRDSLAVIYGTPGTGKTFLALDWALSCATGTPWHGRDVPSGPVMYCYGESIPGLRPRADAWQSHRGVKANCDFLARPGVINLLDDDEVVEFCALVAEMKPILVVIDTLARALVGGDENNSRDMSRAVDNADRIRSACGACVLLIHHGTRSGRNARGHSSLDGAVDTILEISNRKGNTVEVICKKQRNAAETMTTVKRVEVDGSCVLVPATSSAVSDEMWEGFIDQLRTLHEAGPKGLTATEWSNASNLSSSSFYRYKPDLEERGFVTSDREGRGARFTLTDLGRKALHA
jgi:predicted transcriptional regulator/predicted ATP-dependent serine protease